MKQCLLALAVLFSIAIANCFAGEKISFAVVSDLHIGVKNSEQSVLNVIGDINSQTGIEFVVFLGDITESGRDGELRSAYDIISGLEKPCHILTGNHDTKFPESGMNLFRVFFGSERFSFTHKGYAFTGIPSGPHVHDTAASFLREDLTQDGKTTGLPLIFFTHHPLGEITNAGDFFTDAGRNAVIALGGHLHENGVKQYNGMDNIICASSLPTGQGENRYNVVTISGEEVSVSCRDALSGKEEIWYSALLDKKYEFQNENLPAESEYAWKYSGRYSILTGAAFDGEAVYFGNTGGEIISLDCNTGRVNWIHLAGGEIYGIPVIAGGLLLCGSADSTLICLDAKTGRTQWMHRTSAPVTGSAAYRNDTVYFGNSGGVLLAIRAFSGDVVWKTDSPGPLAFTAPIVTEGKICFGGIQGKLYFFSTADGSFAGEAVISRQTPRNFMTGQILYRHNGKVVTATREKEIITVCPSTMQVERFLSGYDYSPSLGYDPAAVIFMARMQKGKTVVFTLGEDEPEVIWESDIRTKWENSFQPPVAAGKFILVPGSNRLFVLDRQTGRKLKTINTGKTLILSAGSSPDGRRLFTVSADGSVICTNLKTLNK